MTDTASGSPPAAIGGILLEARNTVVRCNPFEAHAGLLRYAAGCDILRHDDGNYVVESDWPEALRQHGDGSLRSISVTPGSLVEVIGEFDLRTFASSRKRPHCPTNPLVSLTSTAHIA
jgi:hypothetical protein